MNQLIRAIIAVGVAICLPLAFYGCGEQHAEAGGSETEIDVPDGEYGNDGSENSDDGEDFGGDADSGDACLVREYTVTNGGNRIYGKLYLPENGDGVYPCVILSHSAGMTADSMNSYAIGFAERGYVAYAFDFCGGSSDSRSDGSPLDMTVFTEVEDLKAVMAAMSALDCVESGGVYLFGTSQGGLVSALTANDCADGVKGLILLYPAFSIAEQVQSFYGGREIPESVGFGKVTNGRAYIETLLGYDVYSHIGNYGGDVLILHGSYDFIVSPSYSQRAAEIYENCTLIMIEGAMHGFNAENFALFGDYDEQVWQYIDGYLAER